jgi:hypothetical protein
MTREPETTGIGSLPHHNIDSALALSLRLGIPFLPEIPIRNPWEFMIARALEGLPGVTADTDGAVTLNVDVWNARSREFGEKLARSFERAPTDRRAFEAFEPSPAVSGSWQAFTWELGERGIKRAKVQIAGPMTAQWAIRTREGGPLPQIPELHAQIYRLLLARALAMGRRLADSGIQPMLFLDEPGLYGFSGDNPRHLVGFQELRLLVQALRKDGIVTGIHCCSNTDWARVLALGIDVLSIDTHLSLASLLAEPTVMGFLESGGRLSLGVIPTGRSAHLHSVSPEQLLAELFDTFARSPLGDKPQLVRRALSEAIYTPACGLALHTVGDAELAASLLSEFHRACMSALASAKVG